MIKRILVGGLLLISIISGYFFFTPQELNVGAELPDAPALFETSLAAPITATADSFTLTSNTVRGGGSLSGYNCFTIDEGSAQAEFVCGTASSTSVTGVTRGISPSDGTTAVAALQFAHRRGASVKITDFPIIQILRNQNNGEATFENALRYAGSVVPSSADELADVGYVLSVVNGGTVNFDALVVSGIAGETLSTSTLVYFATTTQRWNKVDTDSTATFQGVAIGLTRGAGTNGNAIGGGGVLLKGLQTGLSGQTAGATYYASSSAGTFSTATSVLPIGQAKSTTELQFDPVMFDIPRLGFNNIWTGTNTFNATTTFNGMTLGFGTASTSVITTLATSTYRKSENVKVIALEMCGGGAGGAGADTDDTHGWGKGGAAGGYLKKIFLSSQLASSTTIVIGAGGTGGTRSGSPTTGGVGGTTIFGFSATTTGGSATNLTEEYPNAGGTATGGNINIAGGISGYGMLNNNEVRITQGASSPLGQGGYVQNSASVNATGYCSGGAGSSESDGVDGGAGTQGVIIITEYF